MKLFPIILAIVLSLGLTACSIVKPDKPFVSPERDTTPQGSESVSSDVSLDTLMNRRYDGRDFTVGRVLDRNAAYTRYYITYMSGSLKISGIMNVPVGDGPFPVLILNHGYIDPAIYTNGRGLKREQDYFARRGYVVIHPDYRNHAESDKDEQAEYRFRLGYTEDVINAIYAIREARLSYIDAEHVGMLGHSMGGGITENALVVQPSLVKAAVLYAPVSANVIDNFNRWTRTRPEVAAKIIADHGEPDQNPEFYARLSPLTYIRQIQTPIMIHHGTNDKDVPLEWSTSFHEALQNASKVSTYHIYQGEAHEFSSQWSVFMQRSVDFFDTYLKS